MKRPTPTAVITDYFAWHAKRHPQDAAGRPVWPAFHHLAGYPDASWLVQAHYCGVDSTRATLQGA